jgi:uroporphyrinogen decarboxylase
MRTYLHSCGSIYELIPDLIEAGYDVINPVQTNCRNMEPERLKKEFGRYLCFWGGGCDTRRVLNLGTPAQGKAHVLERLKIFMPGGGFVFNTVHNILPEVPPANIVAMFAAIEDFNGTR